MFVLAETMQFNDETGCFDLTGAGYTEIVANRSSFDLPVNLAVLIHAQAVDPLPPITVQLRDHAKWSIWSSELKTPKAKDGHPLVPIRSHVAPMELRTTIPIPAPGRYQLELVADQDVLASYPLAVIQG